MCLYEWSSIVYISCRHLCPQLRPPKCPEGAERACQLLWDLQREGIWPAAGEGAAPHSGGQVAAGADCGAGRGGGMGGQRRAQTNSAGQQVQVCYPLNCSLFSAYVVPGNASLWSTVTCLTCGRYHSNSWLSSGSSHVIENKWIWFWPNCKSSSYIKPCHNNPPTPKSAHNDGSVHRVTSQIWPSTVNTTNCLFLQDVRNYIC